MKPEPSIVATPGALDALRERADYLVQLLARHAAGDWPNQVRRAIDPFHAAAVTGRLPRPVAQVEPFLRIGQTHDQRRAAPDAFIRQTDSLLTLTVRPGNRAIHVEECFFQKAFRLHLPHRQTR